MLEGADHRAGAVLAGFPRSLWALVLLPMSWQTPVTTEDVGIGLRLPRMCVSVLESAASGMHVFFKRLTPVHTDNMSKTLGRIL